MSALSARQFPADPLKIRVEYRTSCVLLHLHGSLSRHFDEKLLKTIYDLIRTGENRLIIDCGNLQYINSTGISVFIAVLDRLRETGGDLKLARPIERARWILDRLGVGEVLQHFPSIEEAIDAFESSPPKPVEEPEPLPKMNDLFSPLVRFYHVPNCPIAQKMQGFTIFITESNATGTLLHPCSCCQ